jgi:hypothetical protein
MRAQFEAGTVCFARYAGISRDGGIEALGRHVVHLVFDRDVRALPQMEVFSEQLQRGELCVEYRGQDGDALG